MPIWFENLTGILQVVSVGGIMTLIPIVQRIVVFHASVQLSNFSLVKPGNRSSIGEPAVFTKSMI